MRIAARSDSVIGPIREAGGDVVLEKDEEHGVFEVVLQHPTNGHPREVRVGDAFVGSPEYKALYSAYEEFREVDRVIRKTTLEKFGPVRSVKPTLVFELGFEGIQFSTRHKSGIAVRFPRMLRIRSDKPLHEADTLQTLEALLGNGAPADD